MIRVKRFLHASFIIADLARSRAFYEGLFGFTPNPNRPDFGFPGVWYDIGPNQIHLMQVPDPYRDAERPAHGGRDRHVALEVEDIEAVRAELERAGVRYSMSKSGRPALFCWDPDGNVLELSAA
ncbi:MAG: VOC family protein [Methylophilaceae bacterium]|nr:VOC family protein [Methylophilaceae bacterium]